MPTKKAEGTKYLTECCNLMQKDFETLREHFKPASFARGLRAVLYQYMRERQIPIFDSTVEHHFLDLPKKPQQS